MPSGENAKILFEGGQASTPLSALTDSGDHTIFTSAATLWSNRSGYAPVVRPDGIVTGGVVTPAAAAGDDDVDISAVTAWIAGAAASKAATADESITRPASAVSKVNSITLKSDNTIVVIAGTDGSDANFVETRGVAGGPPYIPVDSIELAQVRVASDTSAPITEAEIFSVPNLHTEHFNYPLPTTNYETGSVSFSAALPASHTGGVTKNVHASYAEPIFQEIVKGKDFVPPETSHSVSPEQLYGRVEATSSASLQQGSFVAYLEDGVTDGLVSLKNETLWFKFFPDRYKSPYILSQGKLGVSRTFPPSGQIQAACTISALSTSIEVSA